MFSGGRRYQIWAEIVNKAVRDVIGGVGARRFFQLYVDEPGAQSWEKMFSDFNNYIKSLLSTTMLQLLLAKGQHDVAAKCCLYGADVNPEQLTDIRDSFAQETERRTWLNNLLMLASNTCTVQLLLDLGADAGAADTDGETALMRAAFRGHEALVNLLLKHHADFRAVDNSGGMALMYAGCRWPCGCDRALVGA